MNNLTRSQIIFIGVACLFGIPTCVGFAIGYFLDFWWGVVVGVLVLLLIAYITPRWQQKRERQNKGKDDGKKD